MKSAAFVYDDLLSRHTLSDVHPLKPARLRYTYELLRGYGVFDAPGGAPAAPRRAEEEELLWFHTQPYIDAVRRVGDGDESAAGLGFNLGTPDNPAYGGMYEAALWSTGASLRAAEMLLADEADVAFSISGGLHHAMPGYASGFCVFNDPVIAIEALRRRGLKVAYVDIDCHHGDGVQHAFYDTDEVLTVSVHESGRYIFPGTGFTEETGAGRGRGYSVNVPLYPYTTDETYLWAFREVVLPLLEAFAPDALVTQLGIDSHFRDPITHLALTVQGFGEAVRSFRGVAPKWLALGGGGYDLQAVARAWSAAYGIMSGREVGDALPDEYRDRYGVSTLHDPGVPSVPAQVVGDARRFAESSVAAVRALVFPVYGLRAG